MKKRRIIFSILLFFSGCNNNYIQECNIHPKIQSLDSSYLNERPDLKINDEFQKNLYLLQSSMVLDCIF